MALGAGVAGCGYRSLYGGSPAERFAVVGAPSLAADAAIVAEVEAGVRGGLARAGALKNGGGYPRVVVEILRVDATSEGVVTGNRGPALGQAGGAGPLSRATRIGIWARAWLEPAEGAGRERDTGDLQAADVMGVEPDARLEALRLDDASRAAARRLGERLARRLLGEPEAPDDGI
jgi:hypothetical protein